MIDAKGSAAGSAPHVLLEDGFTDPAGNMSPQNVAENINPGLAISIRLANAKLG